MKRFSIPALLIGATLLVSIQAAEHIGWLPDLLRPTVAQKRGEPVDDVLCGPRSLHIALNLLGVAVDPDCVVSACRIEPQGVSFGELASFAESQVARAILRQLTWDQLIALRTVCVLYVAPAHYLVVDGRDRAPDGTIRCFDPRRVARWISREELDSIWSGESLILERDRPSIGVHLESYWHDVGFITGETHKFCIEIVNSGSGRRNIRIDGTSCNCTTATLSSETLESGERATLSGTIALHDRRGLFQEQVRIAVEGTERPVSVWVCGGRFADALCRPHEYLGELVAGEEFEKAFFIHDPGDHTLHLEQGQLSAHLHAVNSQEQVPCSVRCDAISTADPAVGTRGRFVVKPGDFRVTLSGRLPAESRLQRIEGELKLVCDLPAPLNFAKIRLSGRIISRLRSDPPALLVSSTAERTTATLRIANDHGARPALIGFHCDLAGMPLEVAENTNVASGNRPTPETLQLDVFCPAADELRGDKHSTLFLDTTEGQIAVPLIFTSRTTKAAAGPIPSSDSESAP